MKFIILKNKKTIFSCMAIVLASMGMTGCEMYAPSKVSAEKIQVREKENFINVPAADVNDQFVTGLANHYSKHGGGSPMRLTVTYDPKNYRNTAMNASQKGGSIVSSLRKNGVRDVSMDILPVMGQGDASSVLVSYDSYTAHAPKDCGVLSALDGGELHIDKDYRLGCTINTMIAKQVSRPQDLSGQENTDLDTDGRSASNIIELYRTGARNEPLEGESASGEN